MNAPPSHAIPEGPEYPSAEWTAREAVNYTDAGRALEEQATPEFQAQLHSQSLENFAEWSAFQASDPTWDTSRNLCPTYSEQCVGDPFRWPRAPGPDGKAFYDQTDVVPVRFYDEGCARLDGRLWSASGTGAGSDLPTIVIQNGSLQAPQPAYWWFAQAAVRAGYAVLTFDPRAQGRSESTTPDGEAGSNANPAVFWEGLVDAIDFLHSTPDAPHPHNPGCAAANPEQLTPMTPYNPMHDRIDPTRLGIAGHSLGATGVSVVQGLDPWPGLLDTENPVDALVAWDTLTAPGTESTLAVGDSGFSHPLPPFTARAPAMGQSAEYGFQATPHLSPPDPEGMKGAYAGWVEAGVPAYEVVLQHSTHFEWSQTPTFPSSRWDDGRVLAEYYSIAWMDRWLKVPGEAGYETADARLLADDDWREGLSFYYRSARNYPDRDGVQQVCEDIRAGCDPVSDQADPDGEADPDGQADPGVTATGADDSSTPTLPATGGSTAGAAILILVFGSLVLRVARRSAEG